MQYKTIDYCLLLLAAILLSACASTTEVHFDPKVPEKKDVVEEPEQATEAVTKVDEIEVEELEPLPEPEPPPEVVTKVYDMDIASSAEQLYGEAVGSKNSTYLAAAEANPILRYTIIYFDFNKSDIKEESKEILSHHADFMLVNPDVHLLVEGHADQRGTSGYNLALGEYRGNALRTVLEAYGVDRSRVRVISYGEEQPAVDDTTEEAFSRNRRAEMIYQQGAR